MIAPLIPVLLLLFTAPSRASIISHSGLTMPIQRVCQSRLSLFMCEADGAAIASVHRGEIVQAVE